MFVCLLFFIIGCKKQNIRHGLITVNNDRDIVNNKNVISGVKIPINFDNEPSLRSSRFDKDNNLKTVYFDFDRSDLTVNASKVLKDNAAYLMNAPDLSIVVEGHTDNRGTTEYNLSLGQRRALKTKECYTQFGISDNRIAAISYGKEKPVDITNNEIAWSRNRRVETKVLVDKK
jgi:peptidoglycan-associated lipoprotein